MNESLSRHKKGPFIASVEQPFAACCLITDKINKTYQGTLAQHAATAAPPHSELLLEPVPVHGFDTDRLHLCPVQYYVGISKKSEV